MDPGGSDLESSLPQTENPCLIVEDSQPDSVALEDDPDSSYRALLSRRLSNLQPTSHSPVLELISSSSSKGRCSQSDNQAEKSEGVPHLDNLQSNQCSEQSQVFEVCVQTNTKSDQEDMESGADSTTHCVQTEEGTSQFGLLELSESQAAYGDSGDEDVEVTPASLQLADGQKATVRTDSQDASSRRPEVSSSSPSLPQGSEGRQLSVQTILHSQVSESLEAGEDEILSSQEDLFDGEKNGSVVDSTVAEPENPPQRPMCTPAHSLRLLHLSGQGMLVQESLSQQSVDFVAATQDNSSQTPFIVPSSPTGEVNAEACNEAAESPMDTSGPGEDKAERREDEPMDTDPAPKPTASTPVSQKSPSFSLEKSLPVPTQPEFSHDVFVPTPSLETGDSSQGPCTLKKKESEKNRPSTPIDAEVLKNPKSSSVVAASFQLELESENSIFDKKTQAFTVEDDSQATQIEEIHAVDAVEKKGENIGDSNLNKATNSQAGSQGPVLKSDECGKNKECLSTAVSLSQPENGQNVSVSGTSVCSQEAQGVQNPPVSQQKEEGKEPAVSTCSAEKLPSLLSQSQSQSLSEISFPQNAANGDPGGDGQPRLSQPASQSHGLESVGTLKFTKEEEEERMDDGEVQSTSRTEGSGLGLALSQSQICSPEPMEEEEEEAAEDKEESQPVSVSKGEESFSVVVLEESQRVSQEKETLRRLQGVFKSASQPTMSSAEEKPKSNRKVTTSQPSGSALFQPEPSRTSLQGTKPSDDGPSTGSQGLKVDSVANRSLSDCSGDLPFHFTLPGEGEVIRSADSATPPHVRQLKNTPLHSTPIETSSLRKPAEANVSRDTTMTDSEISVEESREEGELAAEGGSGKLSLRMKVVTPVEQGSLESDRFSLQKPPLPDEEGSVSKAPTVAKAVTNPSVFSRVREAHRQLHEEEEEEDSSDVPLRPQSQTVHTLPNSADPACATDRPLEAVGNGTVGGLSVADTAHLPSQPNGSVPDSEPGVTSQVEEEPNAGSEQEVPSTSRQALCRTPVRQRAVSQQTSVDLGSMAGPFSKVESVTPSRSQSGPSHRRHVRTIQEVRTTITRIITDVYYEDGREVERKVVEESEEPVVDRCVVDSDVSPSRTGSSMTSGDLADVSSLSSKAPSHHSSSGTSSGGLGHFAMPSVRGGKSGSPRRGGRQPRASMALGSEVTGVRGSQAAAPLSPRGHGRRGRPPSRSPLSRGARSGQRGGAHGQAMSSSEEEPFSRVPGSLVSQGATGRSEAENSGGSSSFVGLRVMAKWLSNSFFYSGTITRDLGENRFQLLFDDNQECEVQGRDILLCDPIPMETEVTALTEEEFFNTGVVKAHKSQGSDLLYCVEKDGQSTWYSRTAVILSMDQGSRLREHYGLGPYEPSTPQTMASDISLDNLVEGKRRRRGNGTGAGTPTRSTTASPRTPGKRRLTSSTEDEKTPAKRAHRGCGARAGARSAACNTSGSGLELPSDPSDLLATHGPLPESTDLFMGFVFMLTASSENDRESNLMSSNDVQTAPYNKHYTKRQLEAGGGMILPEFNEEQCKAAYQSLLIADQHCRTRTYLLCVAGGVPCVSQVWVRDCCQEKKLLNYRNYLLPAGLGPEKRVVEWHARCNPFKTLKVLLISEDRMDLWTALLTMCGAAKVHQHKPNSNGSDVPLERVDVVVTSFPCPTEVLRSAASANSPVVSLEWLIHSVICGERLAYDGRPEYHHDYSP